MNLIRHIANIGLLFSFLTLAVTGILSFVLPFSLATTRVHIVFGFATIILVGLHLATRLGYFKRMAQQSLTTKSDGGSQMPRSVIIALVVVWVLLLVVSLTGGRPATDLLALGYEAQNRAEIFRAAPRTAYEKLGPSNRIVSLSPDSGELVIEVEIEYRWPMLEHPAAAVWAETTRAHMIQTLFIDDALAFSDTPDWHGKPTPRHHILPIWRHGYTSINGVDPNGEIDAITEATPMHSFSIEKSLISGEESSLIVCLEINAFGDPNETYADPRLGQPSILYATDLINLDDFDGGDAYFLMHRVAHGGKATRSGDRFYNFDGITTAGDMIKKVLVHVIRQPATKESPAVKASSEIVYEGG